MNYSLLFIHGANASAVKRFVTSSSSTLGAKSWCGRIELICVYPSKLLRTAISKIERLPPAFPTMRSTSSSSIAAWSASSKAPALVSLLNKSNKANEEINDSSYSSFFLHVTAGCGALSFYHSSKTNQNTILCEEADRSISTTKKKIEIENTTTDISTKVVSTTAVCDQTVSVWIQNDKNRLVYLLGTNHISKLSADLAAQLVQDTHPNAVLVELDLKRVGGSMAAEAGNQTNNQKNKAPIRSSRLLIERELGSKSNLIVPKIDPLSLLLANAEWYFFAHHSPSSAFLLSDEGDGSATKNNNDGFFRDAALRYGAKAKLRFRLAWFRFRAAALGIAIRGMYSILGLAGYKPGGEFISAIREGQKLHADIILGDRDVEVTLTRLIHACAATDWVQLLRRNNEFEEIMKDEKRSSSPTESREQIRKKIAAIRKTAPALVSVLVLERDAYMAAVIDTLDDYDIMVAVMGLAHQDGVEYNLQHLGWSKVNPGCKIR